MIYQYKLAISECIRLWETQKLKQEFCQVNRFFFWNKSCSSPLTLKWFNNKNILITGAYDYTAPEIIDAQSYDEKSDIWSIGTILLDICSTSLYDVKFIFYK
jgi:serine/threonine protein kinase